MRIDGCNVTEVLRLARIHDCKTHLLEFMNAKSPKRRALWGLDECWSSHALGFAEILESKIFEVSHLARTCEDSINDELCFRGIYACKVPKASRFVIILGCRMSEASLFATICEYKCRALRGSVNARSAKSRVSRRLLSAN